MLALHSRTEISLILQKLIEKLTNPLSGGYQNLSRPNGVARYIRLELFPERSSIASILSVQMRAAPDRESRD
jgi:hypothetical protein